jgi:hypothetical protein
MWTIRAKRTQGGRAVAGRLLLTSTDLRFRPSAFERPLHGRPWTTSRQGVVAVRVAARSLEGGPWTGGINRRLEVELTDGSLERFVVRGVDQAAQTLCHELDLPDAPP